MHPLTSVITLRRTSLRPSTNRWPYLNAARVCAFAVVLLGVACGAFAQSEDCLAEIHDEARVVSEGEELGASGKSCTFNLRLCLNQLRLGCTPGSFGRAVKATGGAACHGIERLRVPPSDGNPICGEVRSIRVKTRMRGKKPGRCRVRVKGRARDRRTDVDTIVLVCNPEGTPSSTTTTATTTTTTTTTNPCAEAVPCDCGSQSPTGLQFTTGGRSGEDCGMVSPALCTDTASLGSPCGSDAECGDVAGSCRGPLSCSALYFGGANVTVTLPALVPEMASAALKVACCVADGRTMVLAAATAADVGGVHPNRTCTSATTDNPEYPGKPGCLFGPPLPLPNTSPGGSVASACLVNRVTHDPAGTATCNDGEASLSLPLAADVYITGDLLGGVPGVQPCPICDPTTNLCHGGPNDGRACTPGNLDLGDAYPTSHDCPPPANTFFASILVPFALTTGTSGRSAAAAPNNHFCGFCGDPNAPNFQGTCVGGTNRGAACSSACAGGGACEGMPCTSDLECTTGSFTSCRQRKVGAFGNRSATEIMAQGAPAGNLTDGTAKPSTLVSVFCIPPSFNALVDTAGDLPGPGAVALPGQVQLR